MDRASAVWPDLLAPFQNALPITGASIAMFSPGGSQTTLCSSNGVAARIDELHFELGEGPQLAALDSGELVEIPDAATGPSDRWPIFGSAVRELPVGALVAVPMKMGAVTVGVVTLYRDAAGSLSIDDRASALAIASAIASAAVERALASASESAPAETAVTPALRREVHQATGMILVQLDTTATIAYSRLQAYAFANGRTLQSVAHDVVTRKLVFDDETN